ncbi:sensor histidine kinase [Phocaeicola plebeius]|nr:histidine kinase [Phocaeicola plebeius]
MGQQRMAAVYGVRNLSDKILFMILIMAFNLLLKYFFMQQQKLRLEETKSREAIQTELNFLKNQISPHFFMNTLNNIHALIDYDPDIAKETVLSLSRMMRHILYESKSRRVHIKKEMDFIRSYVELMRLKTSEKVAISCNIPDNLPDKSIPPLIFTSLIENAFKHGVSLKEKSYICIDFSFPDEGHMKCRIANSNHSANRQGEHKGIGLENTKRRLDIEFPSAYILEISDTPNEYTVNINIPI